MKTITVRELLKQIADSDIDMDDEVFIVFEKGGECETHGIKAVDFDGVDVNLIANEEGDDEA